MPLRVELVAPESVLYEGEADMVVCRTTDGEIAFLPGHAPFLGALGVGEVRVLLPGGGTGGKGEEAFTVDGGFVEVHEDKVTVLSDAARLEEPADAGEAGETPAV
ncbi:MAG TPA: F0F1 ATP synthase subunit epsilon [Acidimicrobiia bacterium]